MPSIGTGRDEEDEEAVDDDNGPTAVRGAACAEAKGAVAVEEVLDVFVDFVTSATFIL